MSWCRVANELLSRRPLSWFLPRPRWWNWKRPLDVLERRLDTGLGFFHGLIEQPDIAGRTVLDVGCGMGDRTVAVALAGAASAIGLDNDLEKLRWAVAFRDRIGSANTGLVHGSGTALPFPDRFFDLVLLIDVIEHVDDVPRLLGEIRRVLVPGGNAFVSFPPYRSPWGAHLFEYVAIPWAHLICPDGRLLDEWRRLHAEAVARGGAWVTTRRARAIMRAENIAELWSLNEMTIRHFLDLVSEASLEAVELRLHVPGRIAAPLIRSSVLREYLVTRCAAVLERPC